MHGRREDFEGQFRDRDYDERQEFEKREREQYEQQMREREQQIREREEALRSRKLSPSIEAIREAGEKASRIEFFAAWAG